MEAKTAVVIGAINLDVCGRPSAKPRLQDSNPGSVHFTAGGVGRNIAHNLCLLGLRVKLVSAVGSDPYGRSILDECGEHGMDTRMCRRMTDAQTSTYLYISDENGDMLAAVCDADVSECITPEYLAQHLEEINAADAVVAEGNLSEETVAWIAENVTAPLYADPVSVAKAERMRPLLPRLAAFKPNALEALSMTGKDDVEAAAAALLKLGVGRVFISLGADGILAADANERLRLPCLCTETVNTTGCGDSVTAAIVWGGVYGRSLRDTASAAMRASALCAASKETNSPELCVENII